MSSHVANPPHPISCRPDGRLVIIDLAGDGMLFLTRTEATSLAENLELEIVVAAGDEVVVADVALTKDGAWRLVEAIENILCERRLPLDWRAIGF